MATVVALEGSGYRQPGARMLIDAQLNTLGSISAGCLERDVAKVAYPMTESGPCLAHFDTRANAWQPHGPFRSGCEGVVHVLFERPDATTIQILRAASQTLEKGEDVILIHELGDTPGLWGYHRDGAECDLLNLQASLDEVRLTRRSRHLTIYADHEQTTYFLEYLPAPIHALVIGEHEDALAVGVLAKAQGMRAHLASTSRMLLKKARTQGLRAHELAATTMLEGMEVTASTFVVLMTHHFPTDKALLPALVRCRPAMIGIMGPASRTARLLEELHGQVDLAAALSLIQAPVGLDIGGQGPEALALSIVAQITAIAHDRQGGFLSQRPGPIHQRLEHRRIVDDAQPVGTDRVQAIILAAGASSRMGEPKALLQTDGIRWIHRVIIVAQEAGTTPLVMLGHRADALIPLVGDHAFVVHDGWEEGMGSTIACAMSHLADATSRVVILTVDQPDIDARHVQRLLEGCEDHIAAATRYENGVIGVPAAFSSHAFDVLKNVQGDRGARDFLRDNVDRIHVVDANLPDYDDPQDLQTLRAREIG